MTRLLDRPIWHALTTLQAALSQGGDAARRFAPDVSPLAASSADDDPEAVEALGTLIVPGGTVVLLQKDPTPVPSGAEAKLVAAGVQMVCGSLVGPVEEEGVVDLGDADAPEMLELATLTRPGPFELRTHTLGGFVGIRQGGRLVAMAGERLHLPGYTELSGVCTHPDARGRGYGAALSHVVASRILERGETPFLHAWAENHGAIRLYERLGFEVQRRIVVSVLGRPALATSGGGDGPGA